MIVDRDTPLVWVVSTNTNDSIVGVFASEGAATRRMASTGYDGLLDPSLWVEMWPVEE